MLWAFAGNGANFKILELMRVNNCDVFIAMIKRLKVNMISTVLAKQMGAKKLSFVYVGKNIHNTYFKDKTSLQFSLVVNPELLTAFSYSTYYVGFQALSVAESLCLWTQVILMAFRVPLRAKADCPV